MTLKPPVNPNYAAVVVALDRFVELPNCANVKGAIILNNQVIVGKDAKAGDVGLFFPLETQLSEDFVRENNLFRDALLNDDKQAKGYFEDSRRVKAVKFRGHKSEGFWLPLSCLNYLPLDYISDNIAVAGTTFDSLYGDDTAEYPICQKYIPRRNPAKLAYNQAKKARKEDDIVPNQFRFHYDTEQLRRNIHRLTPNTYVSITDKWHGTSVVIGNLKVKRKLSLRDRVAKLFGVRVQDTEFGIVWSSRCVVKGVNGETKADNNHYYGDDVWGEVAKRVADNIPKGYTIYGEIVGYTLGGQPIQKDYHYKQAVGTNRLLVYRVTQTNDDGKVVELSWQQLKEFCLRAELDTVPELYQGELQLFMPLKAVESLEDWQTRLLEFLDNAYVQSRSCYYNDYEVPAEGIVVRTEALQSSEAFKLKSYEFLERETKMLDKGEVDLETEQTLEASNEVNDNKWDTVTNDTGLENM